MTDKLLPCPKCGSKNVKEYDKEVTIGTTYCDDCLYSESTESWNTRAYIEPVREELMAAARVSNLCRMRLRLNSDKFARTMVTELDEAIACVRKEVLGEEE